MKQYPNCLKSALSAVQDYDGQRLGRFARHAIGFNMAVETPLGLGPLEFGKIFGEETHNIWLKSLLGYGWLGFISYLTMVLWTLIGGFKLLFRPRPWQPYFIIAYSVFFGHIVIGWVIDVDHWRHLFLIIGLIWGCMALEFSWQNYRRQKKSRKVSQAWIAAPRLNIKFSYPTALEHCPQYCGMLQHVGL